MNINYITMSLRGHIVSRLPGVCRVAISILSSFSSVIANSLDRMKQSLCMSFLSSVIANPLKRMKQYLFLSFQNITLSFRRKPESSFIFSFLTRIRGIFFQALARRMPGESRILLSLRGHAVTVAIFLLTFFTLPSSAFAEEKIPVFPTTPVETYTVYASLAILWVGIFFLIVIIKMKLNEIERIQKLGIDEEDKNALILE